MRIHTDTITRTQLFESAQNAGIRLFSVVERGSRSRDHAFEVAASGSSPYRSQADPEEYAATWDEWGIFIRTLFTLDPEAICGQWQGLDDLQAVTGAYFDYITPREQHKRHKLEYSPALDAQICRDCDLSLNWSKKAGRH